MVCAIRYCDRFGPLGAQCAASSNPGYGNGVASGKSLKAQLAIAALGGGLLASYKPGR